MITPKALRAKGDIMKNVVLLVALLLISGSAHAKLTADEFNLFEHETFKTGYNQSTNLNETLLKQIGDLKDIRTNLTTTNTLKPLRLLTLETKLALMNRSLTSLSSTLWYYTSIHRGVSYFMIEDSINAVIADAEQTRTEINIILELEGVDLITVSQANKAAKRVNEVHDFAEKFKSDLKKIRKDALKLELIEPTEKKEV